MHLEQLTTQAQKYVALLERRLIFLQDRVKQKSNNNYDLAEINALEWVVTLLTDGLDTTRLQELYHKYHLEEDLREKLKSRIREG